MITVADWMPRAVERLSRAFGPRLRFVGLQGSYRRGEATETSDIDLCVILDRLDAADFPRLREALAPLPESEKAAGFVSGQAELRAWPAFELFAFSQDMAAWHGELAPLLPPITEHAIRLGCRVALASLCHEATQALLPGTRLSPDIAKSASHSLAKAYLRALQGVIFVREGIFPRDRAEALRLARPEEAAALEGAGSRSLEELAAWCRQWSAAGLVELARAA